MSAFRLLAICATVAGATTAYAQDIDWQKVDAAIGRGGAVTGDVHRYGFPRTDLQVTVDGVAIRPTLALHARDDRFTVFFNDKPLHVTKDSTPEPRPADGRVGLWVKSDSVTYFDRLEIRKFP